MGSCISYIIFYEPNDFSLDYVVCNKWSIVYTIYNKMFLNFISSLIDQENLNSKSYLSTIKMQVLENLRYIQHAPSVQMQEVSANRELKCLQLDTFFVQKPIWHAD